MASQSGGFWSRVEPWSPIGFLACGSGFLIALVLLVVDQVTAITVPEMALSVIVLPSFLALTFLALPGFYPYVAEASPRLALAGVAAAVVAAASLAVTTVGKVILHLMGVIGFTDEGPLLAGFFLLLIGFFLSVLFYGLASVLSGEPSRLVGYLLLAIVLEPGVTLLNDLVGVDVGLVVAFTTLGLGGLAFLATGYLLRTGSASARTADPSPDTAL